MLQNARHQMIKIIIWYYKKLQERERERQRRKRQVKNGVFNYSHYLRRTRNRSAEQIRFFTHCSVVSKCLVKQTPIILHQQNASVVLNISINKRNWSENTDCRNNDPLLGNQVSCKISQLLVWVRKDYTISPDSLCKLTNRSLIEKLSSN